jgi:hypothetical protein
MRIWTQLKENKVFGENILREDGIRVMARCVACILSSDSTEAYQAVLRILRVKPHALLDGMVCSTFARYFAECREARGEREGDKE